MRPRLWLFLALPLLLSHASLARAQRYGSGDEQPYDFAYTRGVTAPYGGASPNVVYNYQLGQSFFFLGLNRYSLGYSDYLDRFDRALKFGYPIPRDPSLPPPRVTPQGVPVVVDPADPNADPADFLPQPPPRRGLFRRY